MAFLKLIIVAELAKYVQHDYIFTISQMWLTSHPRSTEALLDTGTPGTSREIYSEDADDGTRLFPSF